MRGNDDVDGADDAAAETGMSLRVWRASWGVGSGRDARMMPRSFAAMAIQPREVGKVSVEMVLLDGMCFIIQMLDAMRGRIWIEIDVSRTVAPVQVLSSLLGGEWF